MTRPVRCTGAAGGAIAAIVAFVALSLAHAGCRRPAATPAAPPRPCLESIHIEDGSGAVAHDATIDPAALAAVLRRTLLSSGLVDGQSQDAATVTGCPLVRIVGRAGFETTEVGSKGIVRAAVTLRLATRPSDAPGAINDDLSGAGERPYDVRADLDRHRLGQELVDRTAADLLGGLLQRLRLTMASPAEIHRAINGDGGALRIEAIRLAGARGLRDDVPALLGLLQSDDESLRDASLGALISLREPRAVTALTRNRSLRDRHEMRKILEAIAIIGGDEAENYLSFVAESHDDDEIRKLAAEAKVRMDRHVGRRDR